MFSLIDKLNNFFDSLSTGGGRAYPPNAFILGSYNNYLFQLSLPEKQYPDYLKHLFFNMVGYRLNLKNPKTFNEKIQYLKLYDSTSLKTQLTDKFLVRDYVKNCIGENYLKPIFNVYDSYDEINFDNLPNRFVIKCNHGCKWQFIIKDKNSFLNNTNLKYLLKKQFAGWMNQSYCFWSGLELQYKDISPKIIIEQLLRDNDNKLPMEIEIYCFNGEPKIIQKIKYYAPPIVSTYDDKFNNLNFKFKEHYVLEHEPVDNIIINATSLSKKLAKNFKLVRVDWLVYNNQLYFNEMTFTPFSGFIDFPIEYKDWNLKLGKMLNLKGNK